VRRIHAGLAGRRKGLSLKLSSRVFALSPQVGAVKKDAD
jgi:hypothetical protein